jgi:hypothetical protein
MNHDAKEKRYLSQKGTRCPNCQSQRLNAEPPVANDAGDIVTCDVTCLACGESWQDHFRLCAIKVIRHGAPGERI